MQIKAYIERDNESIRLTSEEVKKVHNRYIDNMIYDYLKKKYPDYSESFLEDVASDYVYRNINRDWLEDALTEQLDECVEMAMIEAGACIYEFDDYGLPLN